MLPPILPLAPPSSLLHLHPPSRTPLSRLHPPSRIFSPSRPRPLSHARALPLVPPFPLAPSLSQPRPPSHTLIAQRRGVMVRGRRGCVS